MDSLCPSSPCHYGVLIDEGLSDFFCQAIRADYLVAHNYEYNIKVIEAEAIKAGYEKQYKAIFETREPICTKKTTANLVKIPGPYGGHRNPKLSELHQFLFKSSIEEKYSTASMVKTCAKCFFELKRKGHYKIFVDALSLACSCIFLFSNIIIEHEEVFDFV